MLAVLMHSCCCNEIKAVCFRLHTFDYKKLDEGAPCYSKHAVVLLLVYRRPSIAECETRQESRKLHNAFLVVRRVRARLLMSIENFRELIFY